MPRVFLTQLAIKRPFNFPPHPMSISALPGENRTNKILYFCPRKHYFLIKIRHTTHFFHISITWLTVHPVVCFSTGYSEKMFEVSAHYVTTGTEMVSPVVDSSVNYVLLQINPDFSSHFLNSSTFLKFIWLTQCCMTVKLCNQLAVRNHSSEDIKFIEVFFCFLQCTYHLFWFSQVVRKHTLGKVGTKTGVW